MGLGFLPMLTQLIFGTQHKQIHVLAQLV